MTSTSSATAATRPDMGSITATTDSIRRHTALTPDRRRAEHGATNTKRKDFVPARALVLLRVTGVLSLRVLRTNINRLHNKTKRRPWNDHERRCWTGLLRRGVARPPSPCHA